MAVTAPIKKKTNRGKAPSIETVRELWARSAGYCAYPGCGDCIYLDRLLLRKTNFGEIAHNVAASPDGPRGDPVRSHQLSDDPENLIMFCTKHHTVVDEGGAEHYPEDLLRSWKELHEANIQMAAKLSGGSTSVPVVCAGPIAERYSSIDSAAVCRAMVDNLSAPHVQPINVQLPHHGHTPGTPEYWNAHAKAVYSVLDLHVKEQKSLSVFALADMPTLMVLGHLLSDKAPLEIYQYRRDENTWSFEDRDCSPVEFRFTEPTNTGSDVALVIGLSAKISDERVHAALGEHVQVVRFEVDTPNTALVKGPATIAAFRRTMRSCLDSIEREIGAARNIHVFPAMPASLAVAFGACVMPKVSNPITVYDAKGPGGVFAKAITLPYQS